MTPDDTPATTEPNSTGSATASPDPAISSYIDEQLKSTSYEAWLSAAECEFATADQLTVVAKRCANIPTSSYSSTNTANRNKAVEIARAICDHPNATDQVIAALAESNFSDVLAIAAASPYAGETALTRLAERCANIPTSSYSSTNQANRKNAMNSAEAICDTPNATDQALAVLGEANFSDVLVIAAKSSHAGEATLTRLSERCAGIPTSSYSSTTKSNRDKATELAKAICNNPNATPTALQPLANANFGSVIEIGHDAIDALTP